MEHSINTPFQLPCGKTIRNRLVKAAMTERISDQSLYPTERHEKLYAQWSETGAGLLITGNVTIDRIHLESAGNVCLDHEAIIPSLKKWAAAATKNGNHCWVQISHAGRQTSRFNTRRPKAPSAVQLKKMGLFAKPQIMTHQDINEVIRGFSYAAMLAKKAGFTGVQIHSAHGYLLSQFLSPLTNTRTDEWGGSLKNRSRLLRLIVQNLRKELGDAFPISVKLNSSDFQKGGLTEEESLEVVKMLAQEGLDLLEISGGTYEQLVFFTLNDEKRRDSSKRREAYFISFAKKIRDISNIPLMVTGGFRSFDFCNQVLDDDELDLIGMARPFITNLSDIPNFLEGKVSKLENLVLRTGIKAFDDAAEGGYYARQIIRISRGQKIQPNLNPLWSSNFLIGYELVKTLRNRYT